MALEIWVLEADVVKGEHLFAPPPYPLMALEKCWQRASRVRNQKAITMSSCHCHRMALPWESSLSMLQLKNPEPWRVKEALGSG